MLIEFLDGSFVAYDTLKTLDDSESSSFPAKFLSVGIGRITTLKIAILLVETWQRKKHE